MAALPVGVPCHTIIATFGTRSSESRTRTQHRSTHSADTPAQPSPRRESNPRVRHTKTASCHYITRAVHITSSTSCSEPLVPNSGERPAGVEPAHPPWQGDRLPLHHGRVSITSQTSGSGGNRTHVHLLKRQAPSQRRTHFRLALAGSGPHGSRTRTLPLDRRLLYQRSFWTVHVTSTSRWRRNRTPQDGAVGFGDRVRSQTRSPPVIPSTPCGSRTRPKRLERPPTSPEVERGVPVSSAPRPQNETGRGSLVPPAGAVATHMARQGFIRSYRSDRSEPLRLRLQDARPYQDPDLTHNPLPNRPRDTSPSRRRHHSSLEVRCSRARGSWLYRV